MRKTLTALLLFSTAVVYGQDKFTFNAYHSLDGQLPTGELAAEESLTDGFASHSYGATFGGNFQFFKGFGIRAEFSLTTYEVRNYLSYSDSLVEKYKDEFSLDDRWETGFRSRHGASYHGLRSFKFGPTFTYEFDKVEIGAAVYYGLIFQWARRGTFKGKDTIEQVVFITEGFSSDGFYGRTYATADKGWLAGIDLRYQYNFFDNRRLGIFLDLQMSFGNLGYHFKEEITDEMYPSNDRVISDNSGLDFFNLGSSFGVCFDIIKVE